MKLLLVDDEIEICEFLTSFFEERDYDVKSATSGEEALGLAQSFQPHVILLDIKMPGMDGIKVLEKIKAAYPKMKVIMVTAIETRDKIEECIRLGADNYITKPLSLDYLENDVRTKIEGLMNSGAS
jgi:DNA-binding response OmpR family regulator